MSIFQRVLMVLSVRVDGPQVGSSLLLWHRRQHKLLMFLTDVKLVSNVTCLTKERKNKGLSTIDYLNQIIEHEPKCFKNHYGSPQVYFTLFNRDT